MPSSACKKNARPESVVMILSCGAASVGSEPAGRQGGQPKTPTLVYHLFFFFLRIGRPPKSTLFPSPPPFRSRGPPAVLADGRRRARPVHPGPRSRGPGRSEEHTSELQSHDNLVCRLLLAK